MDLSEYSEVYNSQRLPQVLDTLVARGGVPSVTFNEPVVKVAVLSSIPYVKLHPAAIDFSGVFSPETSDKETEDEVVRHY